MDSQQTFVIRRTFVVPMGLLIVLTIALQIICIVQAQPIAKVIILAALILPLAALFVESALRRVVIDSEAVTAYRPLRQRQIRFADVTSLETVRVRNRVFITLVAGEDDFLIISNSYASFPQLVSLLVAAVPSGTVTEETEKLAQQPPRRQADIFTVWFAVVALTYVLIAQFKS